MRFSVYRGAQGGVGNALRALTTGRQAQQGAYDDSLRNYAYVDNMQAGADLDRAKTAIQQDALSARGGIRGSLEAIGKDEQFNPANIDAILRSNPDIDPVKAMEAVQGGYRNDALRSAMTAAAAGDADQANRFNALTDPGAVYTPYSQSDAGVLNEATGAQTVSDLARSKEGMYDAKADAARLAEVSAGASLFNVGDVLRGVGAKPAVTAPLTPRQQGAGGGSGGGLAPNAQLMKAFGKPAKDETGAPIMDPLTGKQAITFDQEGYDAFLGWYAANRTRYPDINEGILAFKTQAQPAPVKPGGDGERPGFVPLEQRKIGQTYNTPRGPMIWRGNGWEVVN